VTYDPTDSGDLFELLEGDGRIQCKACAEIVFDLQGNPLHHSWVQGLLRQHADKETIVNGKPGTCAGFWKGSR
jgi:hypothetical protein